MRVKEWVRYTIFWAYNKENLTIRNKYLVCLYGSKQCSVGYSMLIIDRLMKCVGWLSRLYSVKKVFVCWLVNACRYVRRDHSRGQADCIWVVGYWSIYMSGWYTLWFHVVSRWTNEGRFNNLDIIVFLWLKIISPKNTAILSESMPFLIVIMLLFQTWHYWPLFKYFWVF